MVDAVVRVFFEFFFLETRERFDLDEPIDVGLELT